MKYKTYNCNSFNVYTIKTDKFKTSHIEVVFRNVAKKEEMGKYSFLADMLSESCFDYPKKRDMLIRFEELYRMVLYAQTLRVGNILNLNFSLDFINPTYISDKSYLEEVIKTLFQVIDKPNVRNDEFDIKTFNIVKERIKREINSLKENPVKQSIKEAFKTMGGKTATSYELLGTLEELEDINPSILYGAYKTLRKEFVVDIFVIGNLNMDDVVSLINKYFKNRYIVNKRLDLPVDNKVVRKVHIGSLDTLNVQSNLVMLFNLKDLSELEKNVTVHVFNYLFGNGGLNSKLYKSIREENSLCYAINSMYLKYDKLLLVQISLDNTNEKKAVNLVKKELKNMQNGKFTIDEVNDAISNMIMSLDMTLDNNMSILNNYIFNVYDNFPLVEERKKLFKTITKEDVMRVSKKIKLNTIFCLKGGDNNARINS